MNGALGSRRLWGRQDAPARVTMPWSVQGVVERVGGQPAQAQPGAWLPFVFLVLLAGIVAWMSSDSTEDATSTPESIRLDVPPARLSVGEPIPRESAGNGPAEGYTAVLQASHKVWLRISPRSSDPREITLHRGARLELELDEPTNLWISNAGAVALTLRGQTWTSLGPQGQSRRVLVDPSNLENLRGL